MSKWYYAWHDHSLDFSIFETAEYDGIGGYETREEAVSAVRSFVMREQREVSLSLMIKAGQCSNLAERLDGISRTLLKLEKD